MNSIRCLSIILLILAVSRYSESVRCYECRSDVLRKCGDPFYPQSIPVVECDHRSTHPTYMCYKASQYVNGAYITVRGCAPFSSDNFPKGFQRAMTGTYSSGFSGSKMMSFCDFNNCNSAWSFNQAPSYLIVILASLITYFYSF